ncbi:methyltransferase [Streptantibioticus parmotrematis]|uniref:methyltransferase n=1 Tax=Streptantibioticus parmotrematis TaxID=2873249 RepID=UPI0033CE20BE
MTVPRTTTDFMWSWWKMKTFLSAVELRVFTALAERPLTAQELCDRTGVHSRPAADFYDALVALDLLRRDGDRYATTEETGEFLDENKRHSYLGDHFRVAMGGFADEMVEMLRTGQSPSGRRGPGEFYEKTYATDDSTRRFHRAMTAMSLASADAIATGFPWDRYRTLADIGCAEGALPVRVLERHPHLSAVGMDLPPAREGFEEYVAAHGMADRLRFRPGDFFQDPMPSADVIVLGHVLHNWGLEDKHTLLKRAHEALAPGGAVVVYETMIDDERQDNAVGLVLSLMMHLALPGGFDYTSGDCRGWLEQHGFRDTYVQHLSGAESMVVGFK